MLLRSSAPHTCLQACAADTISPTENENGQQQGATMNAASRMPHGEMWRIGRQTLITLWLCAAIPCSADVITDWDARAQAIASPSAAGQRESAIVDAAMFDAVNSIPPPFPPFVVQEPVTQPASAEAAAASAAAAALARLHPQKA